MLLAVHALHVSVTWSATQSEKRIPPCPTFSKKGRTAQSLLRLVRKWRFTGNVDAPRVTWLTSGFRSYRYIEHKENAESSQWTITELINSSALQAEGAHMQHFVGIYVDKCRLRRSSIWSLRLRIGSDCKRIVTLEVNNSKREIIQVRAKRNRSPGQHCTSIIEKWAHEAQLQFPRDQLRL